jgi:hypothetical protein
MKIQVRIEMRGVELLHFLGMLARNVSIADVLADHRSVLALHQRIVLAAMGSALGELHTQLLQQTRHGVIDKLRSIVGMQTQNAEGKLMEHGLQYRDQILLADLAGAAYHLPLRHRVHRIDVVDALGALPVALMHGVHPQKAGPVLRFGLAPLGDRHRRRPCRLEHRCLPAVAQLRRRL